MNLALPLLLSLPLSLPRPSAQDPIPLSQAAAAFGEAEEAATADDGKLWGHSLVGPILFADRGTRTVVANQPDEQEKLTEREGVFVGKLPPEVGIANTATDWAGVRWTMVIWPLPDTRDARTRLLLHECFHRIQPELGHGGGDPLSTHLDSEAGRTWLRLEFRALAEALAKREGERQRALEDALLFRARRRALFPEAAAKEASFERNEGLAEYTGLELCGLPAPAIAERAAKRLLQDENAESFVRSFAYATGPAYGILLDEKGAEWRPGIGPTSDLAALLAEATDWKVPAELAQAAEARAARYDGAGIAAAEHRLAEEHARRDAKNRARFVDGPVLELPLDGRMSYTFNPNAITPLAGFGSVYSGVRIVDSWGILETSAGGALLSVGPGGAPQSARVPAPSDAKLRPLAGDGWSLTLEPGWTLASGARSGDWKVVRAP